MPTNKINMPVVYLYSSPKLFILLAENIIDMNKDNIKNKRGSLVGFISFIGRHFETIQINKNPPKKEE